MMIRLRGNTFLLLLLRAGCKALLTRQEYGDSKDGVTRPNMLADLLRLAVPSYEPKEWKTLSSYFSKYLSGKMHSNSAYLPFSNAAYKKGLNDRISRSYPSVLQEMDKFCKTYISSDKFARTLLVAGLVDAILADDSFNGKFDVGDEYVIKDGLDRTEKFILQPFLVSVWNNILMNHPDTREGAGTYMSWTKKAGDNSPREIITDIGAERAKRIIVSSEIPQEYSVAAAQEAVCERQDEQKEHEEPIQAEPVNLTSDQDAGSNEQKQHTVISHNERIYNQTAGKIINIDTVNGTVNI